MSFYFTATGAHVPIYPESIPALSRSELQPIELANIKAKPLGCDWPRRVGVHHCREDNLPNKADIGRLHDMENLLPNLPSHMTTTLWKSYHMITPGCKHLSHLRIFEQSSPWDVAC